LGGVAIDHQLATKKPAKKTVGKTVQPYNKTVPFSLLDWEKVAQRHVHKKAKKTLSGSGSGFASASRVGVIGAHKKIEKFFLRFNKAVATQRSARGQD
jgi:hypothetical protein